MSEFMKAIKLQELRKKANLSRLDLSNLAGVTEKTIRNYEQGYRDINGACGEHLYRLSSVLGCNMADLMNKDDYKDDIINRIVAAAVETELNTGCHSDSIEDYDTPLEFYLSNADRDSYIDYLKYRFMIDDNNAVELQKKIIQGIKDKFE